MEIEVGGGCCLCAGVTPPVGQAEMTTDSGTTSDLREASNERSRRGDNQRDSMGCLVAERRRRMKKARG